MINLVSGNEYQTQEMIDAGAISALRALATKEHRLSPLPKEVLAAIVPLSKKNLELTLVRK